MKYFFGFVILIHALIHGLGFIKAFSLAEVKALTPVISKWQGLLWLGTMVLILLYIISWITQFRFSWLIGFCAVLLSQVLIIIYWKNAKFGTLPNVMILVISFFSYGNYHFHRLADLETKKFLKRSRVSNSILQEQDVERLPPSVKKWISHIGAIGKPTITIAQIAQHAEMKMKPSDSHWMKASALQYSAIDSPGFIWTVKADMNPWLNFLGRDKFLDGQGEMLIKLYGLITVVDAQGKKINEGSIQRYLGEMVWLPSLAISPHVQWQDVNDTTAIATMTYQGTSGSGTFYFDKAGDFKKFSAMRYLGNEPDAERNEWILEVIDYSVFEGIRVPSKMTATWRLKEGDWTWLKLDVTDIRYNSKAIHQQ